MRRIIGRSRLDDRSDGLRANIYVLGERESATSDCARVAADLEMSFAAASRHLQLTSHILLQYASRTSSLLASMTSPK
jgi:hypothetical protein